MNLFRHSIWKTVNVELIAQKLPPVGRSVCATVAILLLGIWKYFECRSSLLRNHIFIFYDCLDFIVFCIDGF